MNRRWIWVILAVGTGLLLATLTRPTRTPRSSTRTPIGTNTTSPSNESKEDEAAAAELRIQSPYGDDPGQRKAIAAMHKSIESLPASQWLRNFTLTERSGQQMDSAALLGQPYVASFFFTRCPGSCKQQNDQMRLLQEKIRDRPVRLVSISVDPEADTPEVLSKYAEQYGAIPGKWLFFTGEMESIARIASEVFFLGEVGLRGHPDRFCLVNAQGQVVGKYNWHEPKELELLDQHLNEILDEASQP